MNRKIRSQHLAVRQDLADLITRVPTPAFSGPSPFLLIAHHGPQTLPPNNQGLPFDRHPHSGFETVTSIRRGALAHEDSRSGERVIHEGGVQWMTAGSGIIHNESAPPELRRDGGPIEILQLWLNLPGRLKRAAPNYLGLEAADIPRVSQDAGRVTVHVISGEFGDTAGAMQSLTGATMLSIDLKAKGRVALPAPSERSVFLYVVEGTLEASGEKIEPYTRVEFEQNGDEITLTALTDAHLIYGHAPLIEEPVVARGPFVMSTQQELAQSARDYMAGLFN